MGHRKTHDGTPLDDNTSRYLYLLFDFQRTLQSNGFRDKQEQFKITYYHIFCKKKARVLKLSLWNEQYAAATSRTGLQTTQLNLRTIPADEHHLHCRGPNNTEQQERVHCATVKTSSKTSAPYTKGPDNNSRHSTPTYQQELFLAHYHDPHHKYVTGQKHNDVHSTVGQIPASKIPAQHNNVLCLSRPNKAGNTCRNFFLHQRKVNSNGLYLNGLQNGEKRSGEKNSPRRRLNYTSAKTT